MYKTKKQQQKIVDAIMTVKEEKEQKEENINDYEAGEMAGHEEDEIIEGMPIDDNLVKLGDRNILSSDENDRNGMMMPDDINIEESNENEQITETEAETASESVRSQSINENPDSMTVFDWKIENFAYVFENEHRTYSDQFLCSNFPFRLLLFPQGNRHNNRLSIYLELSSEELAKHPNSQGLRIRFSISLINQLDSTKTHSMQSEHILCKDCVDQGQENFFQTSDLNKNNGFLHNNSLIFQTKVFIVKIREPSPFDVGPDYDSRKETGFVGLKNQGATCYMNSFLQTIFNIPYLRKAVYSMPTANLADLQISPLLRSSNFNLNKPSHMNQFNQQQNESSSEDSSTDIALGLQRVFYELQFRPTAVPTKSLTKSFGQDKYEAFQQHDVQEFSRILCDVLEDKMKNTGAEGTISKMFEGKCEMFVDCLNVDYKSTRVESFYDLSLTVKGCDSLMHSIDEYCIIETLEGKNQYYSEQYGPQDARKGIRFLRFPPILQLQLKRFEFSLNANLVKVNDKFSFPDELDLNKFIDKSEAESENIPKSDKKRTYEDNIFCLHSVLVHSGSVYGGHYQVFIRPDAQTKWYRFDDDVVIKCLPKHAIDDNFGGPYDSSCGLNETFFKSSSAYMLVYVRKSERDLFLNPLNDEDVPLHLKERFKREKQRHLEAQRQLEEERQKINIYIGTFENNLKPNKGLELAAKTSFREFRLYKNSNLNDFRETVEQEFGIPVEKQQWQFYKTRQNGTQRTNSFVDSDQMTKSLFELSNISTQFFVFELSTLSQEKLLSNFKSEIFLYLKFYDYKSKQLHFIGGEFFHSKSVFNIVKKFFCELMSKSYSEFDIAGQNIIAFEEEDAKKLRINSIDFNKTIKDYNLFNGDIIIFQIDPLNDNTENEQDFSELENEYMNYGYNLSDAGGWNQSRSDYERQLQNQQKLFGSDSVSNTYLKHILPFKNPRQPPNFRFVSEYLTFLAFTRFVVFLPYNEIDRDKVVELIGKSDYKQTNNNENISSAIQADEDDENTNIMQTSSPIKIDSDPLMLDSTAEDIGNAGELDQSQKENKNGQTDDFMLSVFDSSKYSFGEEQNSQFLRSRSEILKRKGRFLLSLSEFVEMEYLLECLSEVFSIDSNLISLHPSHFVNQEVQPLNNGRNNYMPKLNINSMLEKTQKESIWYIYYHINEFTRQQIKNNHVFSFYQRDYNSLTCYKNKIMSILFPFDSDLKELFKLVEKKLIEENILPSQSINNNETNVLTLQRLKNLRILNIKNHNLINVYFYKTENQENENEYDDYYLKSNFSNLFNDDYVNIIEFNDFYAERKYRRSIKQHSKNLSNFEYGGEIAGESNINNEYKVGSEEDGNNGCPAGINNKSPLLDEVDSSSASNNSPISNEKVDYYDKTIDQQKQPLAYICFHRGAVSELNDKFFTFHDFPFIVYYMEQENLEALKTRIKKRFQIFDEVFSGQHFYYSSVNGIKQNEIKNDEIFEIGVNSSLNSVYPHPRRKQQIVCDNISALKKRKQPNSGFSSYLSQPLLKIKK